MVRAEAYTLTAAAFIIELVRYSRNMIRSLWLCTDLMGFMGVGEVIDLVPYDRHKGRKEGWLDQRLDQLPKTLPVRDS